MFARLLKINLKPNHVIEFNKALESQVLPMLRKEQGFQDLITFAGQNGTEMVSISLWDRKENADAYNGRAYPEVLKALADVLDGSPQVRTYEVANSTMHKIPVPAIV